MFTFNTKDTKQVAVIRDTVKNKIKKVLHIKERDSYFMQEDENFADILSKYADFTRNEDSEEKLISSIKMKPKYKLEAIPPHFSKDGSCQRITSTIIGKSGSGKSFFTARYVAAYHHMYQENLIYYISANKIENDISYKELLKKASFKKVLIEIDLKTINSVIEFSNYRNCLFVFDDVVDVEVSMAPEKLKEEYLDEKKKTYYAKEKAKILKKEQDKKMRLQNAGKNYRALTEEEIKRNIRPLTEEEVFLGISDDNMISKLNAWKGKIIKEYIRNSIEALLKLGRKNGISVITTSHRFFEGDKTVQTSIDESSFIVLFPYGNVSKQRLEDFLTIKLCFDKKQAKAISDKVFKQYEWLLINTSGINFYMTSNSIDLIK